MPIQGLILTAALMAGGPSASAVQSSASQIGAPRRAVLVADCRAPSPEAGGSFTGPVLQVIDGRTLCVALGPTPDQWVRVRLADVHDRHGRGALMAAAFAKDVICTARGRDSQGVLARCEFNGQALGALAADAGIKADGQHWR